MHSDLFRKVRIENVQDWMGFWNAISEKSRVYLEWQANSFAGLVLVPREHLESEIRSCLPTFSARVMSAKSAQISEESIEEQLRKALSSEICRRFDVSPEVIKLRIELEQLFLSAMA